MEDKTLLAAVLDGGVAEEPAEIVEVGPYTGLSESALAAAATAYLPDGVTAEELAEQLTATGQLDENQVSATGTQVAPAGFTGLIPIGETEANDTIATADPVPLGFDGGEDFAVDVSGSLGLGPNFSTSSSTSFGRIQVSNAFGTAAGQGALYMDVTVNGVNNRNEAILTTDLSGVTQATLSFFHADFNDEQHFLPLNFTGSRNGDGVAISDDGISWHRVLGATNLSFGFWQQVTVDLDAAAASAGMSLGPNFQIKFQQFDNFALPTDGRGYDEIVITDDMTSNVIVSESFDPDVDFFAVDLEPGDIFGANVSGGANHLTFRDPSGNELIGSGQDVTFIHPAASPLPGGGNAALSYVIDTAGTYTIAVDGGSGAYTANLRVFRPELESQQRTDHQILFLDFDGASIDAQQLFGGGNSNANLSPLSDFLGDWGLTDADLDSVIDAIVATVQENLDDVGLLGNNGDFETDGIDGHYQVEVLNSRDHSTDALGFPIDLFGSPNVSRVIVGGSIPELGIGTLGIAESIDVGNFETEETAVVLLDLLSGPTGLDSINTIPRAFGVSIIDAIGQVVGNITTHEAGHFFANWHQENSNFFDTIMDRGGNGVRDEAGVGLDGIFGTADDIDVDYGKDAYAVAEGFTGTEDTLNAVAFGLSTGTVDPGMIVVASSPADNQQVLFTAPTDFVIDFIDPYDSATVQAGDLTVNGTAADSVSLTDADTLTFHFNTSPVVGGLNTLAIAPDALNRLSDADGVAAFSATFGFDAVQMEVVSTDPTDGAVVELPFTTLRVNFNEPFGQASVGTNDLIVSQGSVTGFNFVDADTVEYVLDGILNEGPFTVSMADGAVTDAFGNFGTGFSASYTLDFGQFPYPVPLVPKEPLGSLIYDPSLSGTIGPAGDTDSFAISVDPGQTITVVVDSPPFEVEEDFESGSLGPQWSTTTSTPNGRIRVTGAHGTAAGAFALVMDRFPSGSLNLNEAILTVDLSGLSQAELSFFHADFNDEQTLLPSDFVGSAIGDGVAISDDGVNWHTILNATNGSFGVWNQVTVDLAGEAAAAGMTLGAGFQIKFQQFDNFPLNSDGRGYDEIVITTTLLQPTIELVRPDDDGDVVHGSATAAASGEDAVLQTAPTVGPIGQLGPGPSTYIVTVGGAAGTTGNYTVQIILNAAIEGEEHDGSSNDTLATAQDLEPTFLDLLQAIVDDDEIQESKPERGAVLGSTESATLTVFEESFESGSLGSEWTTSSSQPQGRILVSNSLGAPVHSGSFHLTMDRSPSGSFNLNEAILTVDLSGLDQVDFSFWQKDVGDEEHALPSTFVGSANGDGVSISEDGITWHTLVSPFNSLNFTYTQFTFDLDEAAAAAGITLGADFRIKFQQFDNFPFNSDGRTFDDIVLTATIPVSDFYSFDLQTGESATLALAGQNAGVLGLELLDADGNVVAVPDPGPSISEDFESGSLGPQWTTSSSNATGRIQVTGAFGTADGSFALLMDDTTTGGFTRNEAILTVDLSQFGNPILSFSHADIGDEQHSLPSNFTGSANGDGVAISDDGVNWHTVLNATNVPSGVWQQETFDLAAEAAAAGMTLGANFQIKFQQFDNFPLTSDGRGYDEITITDSGGPTNVDAVISNFVAPVAGTYFARVTGTADTDYSLVVTRNADFSIENNGDFDSAQEVLSTPAAGRQWVLGHIGAQDTITLQAIDSGWYDITGRHSSTNTNYLVGLAGPSREFHNFFVFDLSSVSSTVVSAELGLFNPTNGYISVDSNETYSVSDVSTPISTLRAGGFGQTAIFNDLGTGVELGSRVISSGDVGQIIPVSLNADGVAILNANSGGQVALGGAITSISGTTDQLVFGFTNNAGLTRQLTVSTADTDFYQITLGEGKPFEVETFTPAVRSGEFVNEFDPAIRLYDSAGNLVASDDNSKADGRNARLKFKVPKGAAGTYFIEVIGEGGSSGEYLLAIKGNKPTVASSSATASGSTTTSSTTTIFSAALSTDSLATDEPEPSTQQIAPADADSTTDTAASDDTISADTTTDPLTEPDAATTDTTDVTATDDLFAGLEDSLLDELLSV